LWQVMERAYFYPSGREKTHSLGALDVALWDLKGKALGVPVWQLIGGKVRDRVEVYGWIGGGRPPETAGGAKGRLDQGFRKVKMNATEDLGWLDSPKALDATLERVAAVRETGMDVGLDF